MGTANALWGRGLGAVRPEQKTAYRPDIDGLRAIAVLVVVGYHAFPNVVHGGMVGVDIFFVISGFLITGILLEALVANRFSFIGFYVRRVRRIFPALALVLGSCLVAGWFLLYDVEYKPLGTHVAGGAAFISNFVLASEAGYFDSASDYKELLHLWSLAVEEQFYLLFPLLLFLCRKNLRIALLPIAVLLIASFGFNVWLIDRDPTQTYYSPATRFWELMIGAALAYYAQFNTRAASTTRPSQLAREVCSWSGVALIALALYLISDASAFPGWLALFPTVGALLVIAAGPLASFNRYVLSARPMVFVGLISYPLYLWHWPLLSFQRVLTPENPGRVSRIVMVGLSILLAWGTYRLLETPIRRVRQFRPAAVALCLVMALLGVFGLIIANHEGVPTRTANARDADRHRALVDALRRDTEIRHQYPTRPCEFPAGLGIAEKWCETFGDKNADVVVLWGDSHAAAWAPVFYSIAAAKHFQVVRFSIGGCPPLLATRRIDAIFADAPCGEFGLGERLIQAVKLLKPAHVFLLARWSLYTPSKIAVASASNVDANILRVPLARTLDALSRTLPVTIFRTAPVIRDEPARALLRHTAVSVPITDYRKHESRANATIDAISSSRANVTIFDPSHLLCTQTCTLRLGDTVLYANATHLSAQGAMLAADEIDDFFPDTMLVTDGSPPEAK
jgi:peptidoglycan/LPS O-acetylase OafA/YrhL